MNTRRGVVLGALLVATQAGCAWGPSCPDVQGARTVVVRLADGWTATPGLVAVPECPGGQECGRIAFNRDDPPDPTPESEFVNGVARLVLWNSRDDIAVHVRDAHGGVLASAEAELEWVRVGGTEACGGPMEAEVVVPAP